MESAGLSLLLNRLAAMSGCLYISDLHDLENSRAVSIAVRRTEPEDYDLLTWLAAAQYITGLDFNSSDVWKLHLSLIASLEQRAKS